MLFKSCPVKVKATGEADGLEDGQFEAIVSVFGNKDSYGDIVQPGAFAETLKEWEASGNPIPVYYSHRMDDPDYNIGTVIEAKETDEGLWVKAQLRLEATSSKAPQVYELLKDRSLAQFSFAYDVVDGGWEKKDDEEFYSLRKLKVYEVGPTPIGANQDTELLAVKMAREIAGKAGRVISAKNETALREALSQLEGSASQIQNVLSALESIDEDDEKAALGAEIKDEGRRVKSEDALPPSPADLSALQHIELAAIGDE